MAVSKNVTGSKVAALHHDFSQLENEQTNVNAINEIEHEVSQKPVPTFWHHAGRDSDEWRWSAGLSRRSPRPAIRSETDRRGCQNRDGEPGRGRYGDRTVQGNGAHRAATREATIAVALMTRRLVKRVPEGVVGADHACLVERPRCRRIRSEPPEHDREQRCIGREHSDPSLDLLIAPCRHGPSE